MNSKSNEYVIQKKKEKFASLLILLLLGLI